MPIYEVTKHVVVNHLDGEIMKVVHRFEAPSKKAARKFAERYEGTTESVEDYYQSLAM